MASAETDERLRERNTGRLPLHRASGSGSQALDEEHRPKARLGLDDSVVGECGFESSHPDQFHNHEGLRVDRERAKTLRTTASVLNDPIPRG